MTTTSEQTPVIKPPPRLGRSIRRNPIALKELRGRMRGPRAFIVLTVYVVLMSLFAVILYLIYAASSSITLNTTGGVIGKIIFAGVVAIELFLVCFVAPAFTAGSISGERERRTFHLLRTTLLPARRIVVGKLISALAYIILLLAVAIPLQSLAFLMGGITVEEVVLSVEILIVTAIGYGAVGIFFSALTRRTLVASILTYTFALMVTIALPLGAGIIGLFSPSSIGYYNHPVAEAVVSYLYTLVAATNPVSAAVGTELILQQQGSAFYYTEVLSNGAILPMLSPWVVFTVFYLGLAFILVLITVNQVRHIDE
ncbi:MAG: ABC transporter permease subunit [Anaerolineae bacterium]|nr:ABC transporter permease subunit [Anaerolineae bacterium]